MDEKLANFRRELLSGSAGCGELAELLHPASRENVCTADEDRIEFDF